MSSRVRIASTGFYAPPRVETAEQLAPKLGVTPEWIRTQTGVAHRHLSEEPVEQLGAKALRDALGDGAPPDLLISASTSVRQAIPDTSTFILRELGFSGIPGFSVHATCLSFLAATDVAAALIVAGRYRRVAVVSAEMPSSSRRFTEPESASLLGDGAAAAILEASPDVDPAAILACRMATHPEGADLARMEAAGVRKHPADPNTRLEDGLFTMDGPRLFKLTAKLGAPIFQGALADAGLSIGDIDLFVPHQASGPGLRVLRIFGIPDERVVSIIGEYGNCIAASIPMALAIAHADGRLQRGMRVALLGTGAGLSVGALILRF